MFLRLSASIRFLAGVHRTLGAQVSRASSSAPDSLRNMVRTPVGNELRGDLRDGL